MNLAGIADAHPAGATALIAGDAVISYGDLQRRVGGVRGVLAGAGVAPGARVALISANAPAFVVGLLGALGVGAVVVPLNPQAPPAEITAELSSLGAVAAIAGPGATLPDDAQPPTTLVADAGSLPGAIDLAAAEAADPVPLVERDADDVALLMYTSGTAGLPRAAALTHGNVLANIAQIQAHPGRLVTPADVTLAVLPLFHVFGLTANLCVPLAAGGSVVLVPRFAPDESLELCRRHRVTILAGAPPMFAALAVAPAGDGANPLASVRLAFSGAAPLADEVATAVRIRFGLPLYQGYGLTEASPVVTSSVLDGNPRPGSVGVPLPGVEVRLVDEDGEDALAGDPGQVWVRGPNVFAGYWQDPEATRRVLTADGWLRTGDIGVVGDDGNMQLVDRAKDLIIVNGFNVVPAEVEAVLAQHPQVGDVAVVGEASPKTGEAVTAVVVPTAAGSPTLADLRAFTGERLARYKCPTALLIVDAIPRGQAGKLLRRSLRSP
ncbi:MAG: AMP-binding protein [Acidimicrobiales bacterium]